MAEAEEWQRLSVTLAVCSGQVTEPQFSPLYNGERTYRGPAQTISRGEGPRNAAAPDCYNHRVLVISAVLSKPRSHKKKDYSTQLQKNKTSM